MGYSSFPYDWDNVIYALKKINYMINCKYPNCDIKNMDYISPAPIHCSKVLLQLCSKMHKIFWKKRHRIYVEDKVFITWTAIQKPWRLFQQTKEENNFTFPIFDIKLISSSKPLKIVPKYCVFPIKQIKQIKCRPMRQLQPEAGESLAKS